MVKPRIHVSLSDDIYKYAIEESAKFNDSLSALITFCLYLYKNMNEKNSTQEFILRNKESSNIENIQPNTVKKTSEICIESKDTELALSIKNDNTSSDATSKNILDTEVASAIDNILSM